MKNSQSRSREAESSKMDRQSKQIFDLNAVLRAAYEDEGMDYGEDVSDMDSIASRVNTVKTLRTKRIDEVFKEIRRARNVELCFLVDATGSMQPHIDGVRTFIKQIVQSLTTPRTGQAQELKLAFVAYRDFGDKKQFETFPFSSSASQFEAFCGAIVANGGGDGPEDVFGGLEEALKLNWSPNAGTKVLFHICDAPCHGKEFHDCHDDYPDGDPQGRTHTDLFTRIKEKGIQYYFGKITNHTDSMIKKFSQAYGSAIEAFDVKKVERIKDSVISAVNTSVVTIISMSKRAVGVKREERPFTLDPTEPNWDSCKVYKGKFTYYNFPQSIQDIIDCVPLDRSKPKYTDVKIAPNPFANGAERLAYYGRDVSTFMNTDDKQGAAVNIQRKCDDIVLKEYRFSGKGMNSTKRYDQSNQLQTIAAFLAQKFVKTIENKTGQKKTVKFLKIRTLVIADEPVRYMSAERRFAATYKFVRFSNNTNYELVEEKALELGIPKDFVQLVMAFSHWSHQATGGHLMVVDLEGIVGKVGKDDKQGVLLTDPAIHCKDLTRFGSMNHGTKGMESFFSSHQCNKWCRALELVMPKKK